MHLFVNKQFFLGSIFTLSFVAGGLFIFDVQAGTSLVDRLKGYILLRVESNGEAWYVNPNDGKRYSLGSPQSAFNVMKKMGLGIKDSDLFQIPLGEGNYDDGRVMYERVGDKIVFYEYKDGKKIEKGLKIDILSSLDSESKLITQYLPTDMVFYGRPTGLVAYHQFIPNRSSTVLMVSDLNGTITREFASWTDGSLTIKPGSLHWSESGPKLIFVEFVRDESYKGKDEFDFRMKEVKREIEVYGFYF